LWYNRITRNNYKKYETKEQISYYRFYFRNISSAPSIAFYFYREERQFLYSFSNFFIALDSDGWFFRNRTISNKKEGGTRKDIGYNWVDYQWILSIYDRSWVAIQHI